MQEREYTDRRDWLRSHTKDQLVELAKESIERRLREKADHKQEVADFKKQWDGDARAYIGMIQDRELRLNVLWRRYPNDPLFAE